jgi:hypothetical protein
MLSLALHPARGNFDEGSYVLELDTGAETFACQFAIPNALPTRGSAQNVECTRPLSAFLSQRSACTEQRQGNAISQTCEPIPGEYELHVSLTATPTKLRVRIQRDGEALLDREEQPKYETSRPNGPGCEPECTQARVALEIP